MTVADYIAGLISERVLSEDAFYERVWALRARLSSGTEAVVPRDNMQLLYLYWVGLVGWAGHPETRARILYSFSKDSDRIVGALAQHGVYLSLAPQLDLADIARYDPEARPHIAGVIADLESSNRVDCQKEPPRIRTRVLTKKERRYIGASQYKAVRRNWRPRLNLGTAFDSAAPTDEGA